MRILLAEDGDQHIGAGDFLLAVAGGLHMHDGALDDALKAQRRLGIDIIGTGHLRRVVLDEIGQRLAQVIDVGRAGTQNFGRTRVVQQGKQQMLHRDELVALLAGLDERHVQTDFQFLGNHVIFLLPCFKYLPESKNSSSHNSTGSHTHCSGCPALRAASTTCSTLVLATSLE